MSTTLHRDTLAQLSPKLAELSQQVLFDDIWQRPQLSPRERSLITLAALTALGRTAQIPWHIDYARQNGVTDEEIAEAFTHLAFYAGWPAAVSALACLAEEKR
ncbi:carboxymuconolactone decarboxylase family protein [Enterobacter sp. 170198]|jgi:4-carboxymuconolactone decarboxylase|uniref:Carboxymuconolactone decarboxylase family protein n=1 Tax=Enterobacter chinensis TaxID=3030997 RepID=A0ABU5D5J2_9ENTR|nr:MULTISPECIES: carboxymuconolactone decarboxylase family protein [Enterobacteriaceae]MDY0419249.1 carboxymuconolactone decarboxylase family protein [Enterobacter sp. 170198]TFB22494.1 carboxymuconolactone decarboxylase family protein [Lelliottia nimipressuralis]